jgi:selenocysteine lyase/cysteine desulfurase
LPATIRALQQLEEWGVREISQTIAALNRKITDNVQSSGFVAWPEGMRAPHYLCLRSERPIPESLIESLAAERVFVSLRGTSLRITPHIYNSEDDIERLLEVLQKSATLQHN